MTKNMTKKLCTGSIFLAILGVLWLGFAIRMPERIWWDRTLFTSSNGTWPLIGWLVFNVLMPVVWVVIAVGFIVGSWGLAEKICSKLRGEK